MGKLSPKLLDAAKNPGHRGNPPWNPTDSDKVKAETLAGYGVPHTMIALILGVHVETLTIHLSDLLDLGEAKATANVAKSLYAKAVEQNDLGAQIFWLKARAGWRETVKVEHEHHRDFANASTEDLEDQLAQVRARRATADRAGIVAQEVPTKLRGVLH